MSAQVSPKEHFDRWFERHYGQLRGATIEEVGQAEGDYPTESWPVLIVRMADGTRRQVEVSRDPEGNGPGHLFIEEVSA